MDHLNVFFEKFKRLAVPHESIRKEVVEYCSSVLSEDVPLKAIEVRGTTIYINLHPTLKGEILMRREGLLEKVNATLPKQQSPFTNVR